MTGTGQEALFGRQNRLWSEADGLGGAFFVDFCTARCGWFADMRAWCEN